MSCPECDRVARYMAADPEMYRGETPRCSAHRRGDAWRAYALRLEEAVEFARLAIDDWLHQYAHTECDENAVARSASRIRNRGGTLAYIAEIQSALRAALATRPEGE